jgi:hypothetical protein
VVAGGDQSIGESRARQRHIYPPLNPEDAAALQTCGLFELFGYRFKRLA